MLINSYITSYIHRSMVGKRTSLGAFNNEQNLLGEMERLWAGGQEWRKKLLPNDPCIIAPFDYTLVTTRRMTTKAEGTILPTKQALKRLNIWLI